MKLLDSNTPDIIWYLLDKSFFDLPNDVVLCFCYCLPNSSSAHNASGRDLFDLITENIAQYKQIYDCSFILAGDTNARCSVLDDFIIDDNIDHLPLPDGYEIDDISICKRSNEDKSINSNGRRLIELCKMCNLRILNGRLYKDAHKGAFTCTEWNGKSAVDLVLASPDLFEMFNHFEVLPQREMSDHNPVSFDLKVKFDNHDSIFKTPYSKMQWNTDKKDEFQTKLNSESVDYHLNEMMKIINSNVFSQTSVDSAVELCASAIRSAADPYFLKTFNAHQFTGTSKPDWADDEWSTKKRDFNRARDRYSKHSSDQNRQYLIQTRSAYKKHSAKCQRKSDISNTKKLMHAKATNSKLYWKLLCGKNQMNTTRVTKDEFFNYFLSLSNPADDFYKADPDITSEVNQILDSELQNLFDELNVDIDSTEIQNSIKELKAGKSASEDLLLNEFFIHGQEKLLPYLLNLFNFVFSSGHFPSMWSDGLIIPIHKKGNLSQPENFRGITLLSTLGKLFTRVINNRLNSWAEQYGILIEAQYGFRKGRSTTDCIYVLQNIISDYVQRGKKLYALFVDYSKAFDYIVRDNLWFKLLHCGIHGRTLNIITSMYKSVKSKVFIDGDKSESFNCKLGVRQGECLSPFLFAIYVNDLEEKLSNSAVGVSFADIKILLLFYADDLVIFSETAQGLQEGLDDLHDYCNRWKLKINTTKSKIIIFRKGSRISRHDFTFGGSPIEVTNKIRYLGIMISFNGSFYQSQRTLAEQANKAVFLLYKKVQNFFNLKPKHMLDLFDSFVSPILNYGCESWGFHPSPNIELVHTKFCKNLLGVKRSTQNDCVYGLLGRLPLCIIRHLRILKYWLKIVHGLKSLYVCAIYKSQLQNIDLRDSWSLRVKTMLCSSGLGEAWYNQGVGSIDQFLIIAKTRFLDIAKQDWHERLSQSPGSRFYRSVINDYSLHPYLVNVVPKKHRIALTKLLVSSHPLHVETGRWMRPKTEISDRKCFKCPNKIEDEFHFFFECTLYSDIRMKLIPAYYRNRPSMLKLHELINPTDDRILKGLAKFSFLALKARSSEINEVNST